MTLNGHSIWRRPARAAALAIVLATPHAGRAADTRGADDVLVSSVEPGRRGGRLTVAQRSEPKTWNPVLALDGASREVLHLTTADLVRINRQTLLPEPWLASSWSVSPDGRRYTIRLRHALRFSDGHPLDADDVVFSFQLYLDEKNHAPQRDLLLVGGKPITVRKVDATTVVFELAQPYAAAERLFDGFAILPRHVLQKDVSEGRFEQAWGLSTEPGSLVGLGPFRVREFVPGQRVVLERNPRFWKRDRAGVQLPYLDEITFLSVPSDDAQALRFQAGETDVLTRLGAENFAALAADKASRGYRLSDLGPGLESNVLVFNLNEPRAAATPLLLRRQAWFRDVRFRRAVSFAIDRDGIAKLVYRGRATPLRGHVTPGNRLWENAALPRPARSVARGRELLKSAGFSWTPDGGLIDPAGEPVEFSILTSAGNAPRAQIATILQADLKELGMKVTVASLEFRAFVDHLLKGEDYEVCVTGLGGGDADPNGDIAIVRSDGPMHLWHLGQAKPATAWEAEADALMDQQLIALDPKQRKALYDRVQEIVAENLPFIPLVSTNVLVGVRDSLANVRPGILAPNVLWNADELFWRTLK